MPRNQPYIYSATRSFWKETIYIPLCIQFSIVLELSTYFTNDCSRTIHIFHCSWYLIVKTLSPFPGQKNLLQHGTLGDLRFTLLSSRHCSGFFVQFFFFAIQHVYESSFHLGFTCALTALSAMSIAFILHNAVVQQKQPPDFVFYSSHVPQVLIVQMVYPPQVATHQSCSTWHDLVYRVHHRSPQLKKLACFFGFFFCVFLLSEMVRGKNTPSFCLYPDYFHQAEMMSPSNTGETCSHEYLLSISNGQ